MADSCMTKKTFSMEIDHSFMQYMRGDSIIPAKDLSVMTVPCTKYVQTKRSKYSNLNTTAARKNDDLEGKCLSFDRFYIGVNRSSTIKILWLEIVVHTKQQSLTFLEYVDCQCSISLRDT